jgi:hypothetical protein
MTQSHETGGARVALVLLIAACPAGAAAQSNPTSAPAEVVGPTCASPDPSLVDTLKLILSLAGVATPPGNRKNAEFAELEAQALADNFRPPPTFRWPARWVATAPALRPGDTLAAGGLRGTLSLHVDRHGRLIDAGFPEPTDVPELNASLLAAAQRADSTGALAPTLGHDSIESTLIRLDVDTAPNPQTIPFMRLKLPYTKVTTGPSVSRGAPFLIPRSIDKSTDAIVDVAYTIGEDGRVLPNSIRLIHSKPAEMGAPIAGAILNSEFHPARSGACAVKLIVYQRIGLRINVPAGRGPPSAQPLPNPPPSYNDSPPFRLKQ